MSQLSHSLRLKPLKSNPKLWIPLAFVLIPGLILVMMIFTTLAYQILYLERIYPGVFVDGIDVGGMTKPKLTQLLDDLTAKELASSVTVQAGGKSWTFTGQDLGVRIDVVRTVEQAYTIGRQGGFIADMFTHLNLLVRPYPLEHTITYNTAPINEILHRMAEEIDRPPKDAQLIIYQDGRIEASPSQRGRRLHIGGTHALIEEALLSNTGEPIQAVVQEILPALEDVEEARVQAENILGEPLLFRLVGDEGNEEWQLKPAALVQLINVIKEVNEKGKLQVRVELDFDKLAPYLEKLAAEIYRSPVEARLDFDEENNELLVLQESRAGRALNMETTYQQLRKLDENPYHQIELFVDVLSPTVPTDDIEALGIKELVSESTSYFKGSSTGRMNNIALAASRFDGVVIPPGELFSFNEHLGEITKESGFDESLIIFGNRTTVGVGGGVCQVSTTVFRTAFFGGFEIVERWAHGYRVGWYERNADPGLDATIYTPNLDMKFRNDTEHYLLIETETNRGEGTLTFRFYGTKPDREVIVSKPEIRNIMKHGEPIYEEDPELPKGEVKQVDWANDGMDVSVIRVVKEAGQVIHEDEIFSQYRPWRAIYKVGTGEDVD